MYLIPEWFPQDAIMLTWPHAFSDWAENLTRVEVEIMQLAKAITQFEPILIVCYDGEHKKHIENYLVQEGLIRKQIHFALAPSNDCWTRDHGPLAVALPNKLPLLLNFQFNGWGNKYPSQKDNLINLQLKQQQIFSQLKDIPMILEGGSIEINGKQELLTTSKCLLSKNRNNWHKEKVEQVLAYQFGVKKFLWLEHGSLIGDDTDAHIDTLARFVDDQTICYVKCDDKEDENFDELTLMEKELQAFTNLEGKPYHLVPLPWPAPQFNEQGQRLPLTYANFLITNQAVFVPNYNDKADQIAQNCLAQVFKNRKIIGISSQEIIKQFGSLHCLSMQLPKGVLDGKFD